MSGVFGIFDARGRNVAATADAMASRLCVFPTQQSELYCSPTRCEALGRISIGVFNPMPQPLWNEARTVAVVFAGRLIRDQSKASHGESPSDPQLILALYQRYGTKLTAYLRGSFAMAVYDAARRQVLVAADRMGTFPIYFGRRSGRFLFGPTQNSLLADTLISARLDRTGLAQYMRFQQLLHDVTFFEDIKLLRGGHQLVYDLERDELSEMTYWHFDPDRPVRSDLTFEEAADECTRLVVNAVARTSQGIDRIGVFLSGGMDSRMILASFGRLGRRPPTLTYGLPTSRDAHYARKIARRAGVPQHLCYQSNGHWVKQYWKSHLRLVDGSHSWIHMHGIYALADARKFMDVNLAGLCGDTLLRGLALNKVYLNVPDDLTYASRIFHGLNTLENWPSVGETEEQLLYTQDAFAEVKGRAFESLRMALAPFLAYPEPLRTESFIMLTSDIRHYAHYAAFMRSAVEVGLPFLDPDLLDFVLYLPVAYRRNWQLARAVLRRLSLKLAVIPYDHDELLPTDHLWLRVSHEFMSRVNRRLLRLTGFEAPARSTLHSDYENWLRTDLREWAESILFDRRTVERGLFNPSFLRSIWQRHLAGQEYLTLGKIAPVIGYELMVREFVDARPAPPPTTIFEN